ncbi:hypothetical protein GCM10020220_029920 [Nonomuraea rubra]|uniref:aminoglycoside phosphotransferase family protein n=1 Tax=Nonomuraea rubra TaxID=46180 RepID=UPI0031E542D7
MSSPPLAHACTLFGLDARDARLLHLRANAVYHLPRPNLVVRLRHAPGNAAVLERARAAIRITAWLSEHGFPTTKPAALNQPISVDGWISTAWHYVTSTNETRSRPHHLAQILRHLHRMNAPMIAPTIQLLGTLRADLAAHGHHGQADSVLTAVQRAWLLDRCSSVEAAYSELDPPLGYGLIHGDAHTGNLFADRTSWLLGDWDSIAYGPRLQDLVPTMMGHRRFGRPPHLVDLVLLGLRHRPRH